jgi:N-methylhydantoinase B
MDTIHQTSTRFRPRTDAVTFEVLRHRLWQINDEQGQTVINVSGSPVATEGNDFNVALADANGELVAVGAFIVLHVSAITLIIRNTIALLGEENIAEGDMYLINDPWMGAGHQNDFCVIQPVFWDARRIAWTASVIHQIDVGGPAPGSWNFAARTAFEEAPRYKALKIVRGGKVQPEVVATVLTNTRLPDLVELDLRAQVAAANVARERIHALIGCYSLDTVLASIADNFDYAQFLFRRKLLDLPDGSWYAEDHIDHDGHEERTYTVRCLLRKQGDRLIFDYRGTSKEAPGLINCPYAGAAAGAYCAVYPLLCEDIPWNAGVLRQVDVEVDDGTIHSARFPAPVGYGVVHASWATLNASALALGKLLSSSVKRADAAMAGWSGSTFVYNIFGENERGQRFATMLLSSDLQGCGARAFGDGYDVGGKLNAPRSKVATIESIEAEFPFLYLYRKRTTDSGGAGLWRGGVSAEVALTVHRAKGVDFTANTVGVNHSSTIGICGGYPGGNPSVILVRDTDLAARWRAGELPHDLSHLSGATEMLPAKKVFVLRDGDVFVAVPHGGGGYGDPLEREPRRVAADVRQGLVSREWAGRLYGAVLDGAGEVLVAATAALRADIRGRRMRSASAPGGRSVHAGARLTAKGPEGRLGAILIADRLYHCGGCRRSICGIGEKLKDHLLLRRGPLGDAGPQSARRWGGESPTVELWQYVCPNCGQSSVVEQHLKSENAVWEDRVVVRGTADQSA